MGILSKINIRADLANRLEIIDMFEKSSESKKICEIGPGGKPLIIEYPINGEFYGIEYPGCAEEPVKIFRQNNKTILMKECDLSRDKWPFEDNEFDVVVSNQVLEHMTNTDHFFEEFYRISDRRDKKNTWRGKSDYSLLWRCRQHNLCPFNL